MPLCFCFPDASLLHDDDSPRTIRFSVPPLFHHTHDAEEALLRARKDLWRVETARTLLRMQNVKRECSVAKWTAQIVDSETLSNGRRKQVFQQPLVSAAAHCVKRVAKLSVVNRHHRFYFFKRERAAVAHYNVDLVATLVSSCHSQPVASVRACKKKKKNSTYASNSENCSAFAGAGAEIFFSSW